MNRSRFALGVILACALAALGWASTNRILSLSYSSTSAIQSDDWACPAPSSGLTTYVYASTAGTVTLYYLDMAGVPRALTPALAVAANDLTVIDEARAVPKARLIFTPSSQPGTVTADMFCVGSRDR